MEITPLHSWDVSPKEAIKIQRELRRKIIKENVLNFPTLSVVEQATAMVPVTFPYIPGLLAFREGPAVLPALEKLNEEVDLFLFDAQGLAHPRRMGLATHIGIILDRPSAVKFVLSCCRGRRLPEPTGLAHELASGKPLEPETKRNDSQPSLFDGA